MTTTRGIRRWAVIAVLVVVTLATALAATASNGAAVESARNATYGSILVDSGGLTLYHLTSETNGEIKCTGACATLWPPLLVAKGAKPIAGAGVPAGKLGTITRPGGQIQVSYDGLPLYRYSADKKPGEALGEGVGGVWFVVGPAGKIVKQSPASTTTTTTAGRGNGY